MPAEWGIRVHPETTTTSAVVRPSGFEPETCGIERSDLDDEEVSVKGQFRYPFV
jgi:hypothetical protein